jgi:DNA-binding XRE family transcriptional regulator
MAWVLLSLRALRTDVPMKTKRPSQRSQPVTLVALRDLREARGVTQQDLAHATGMQQSEISRLERGRDYHVSTLAKVVVALGGQLEVSAMFGKRRVRLRWAQD